ncbi:hypothetical protein F5148DRAFT_1199138 [Russula earlei]|uniref:Uncharacterized protein n=1 Tax=Russula earlei TaxID=71964 RepID=A0ACC0UBA8_9AGAM|nr:hypothetical protein F5148DRAFT_1199138 [Russula earlei]
MLNGTRSARPLYLWKFQPTPETLPLSLVPLVFFFFFACYLQYRRGRGTVCIIIICWPAAHFTTLRNVMMP